MSNPNAKWPRWIRGSIERTFQDDLATTATKSIDGTSQPTSSKSLLVLQVTKPEADNTSCNLYNVRFTIQVNVSVHTDAGCGLAYETDDRLGEVMNWIRGPHCIWEIGATGEDGTVLVTTAKLDGRIETNSVFEGVDSFSDTLQVTADFMIEAIRGV